MNGINDLESAEAELGEVKRELEKAVEDLENVEHKIEEVIEKKTHPDRFEVTVLYNGVPKSLRFAATNLRCDYSTKTEPSVRADPQCSPS